MSLLTKETIEKLEFIDKMDISNKVIPDFEDVVYHNSDLKEKYPLHIDFENFAKHYTLDFFIELLKEDLTSLTPRQKMEYYLHTNIQAKLNFHSKIDFRNRFKRVRFWVAFELAVWLHNHFDYDVKKTYSKESINKIETAYKKLLKIKTLHMTPTKATNLKYNILSFVSLVYGKEVLYKDTIIVN